VTGIRVHLVLDADRGTFWTMTSEARDRVFRSGFHSGTIACRRRLRERGVEYPASSKGEDVELIRRLRAAGVRICAVENRDLHVYVRHGSNAWGAFGPGRGPDDGMWLSAERPDAFPSELVAAYCRAAAELR
jgi:hypothetical protein